MGLLFAISIFIVSSIAIIKTDGQTCRPGAVQNLTLSDELMLSWEPPPDETCIINHYDIFIRSAITTEYAYSIINTTLPANFLRVCDVYRIAVAAVSADNLDSGDAVLNVKAPIPEGTSVVVDSFSIDQFEQGIYLGWSISDKWGRCIDLYSIYTYVNDEEPEVVNTTYPYVAVADVVPCSQYMFGVVIQTIYGDTVVMGPMATVNFTVEALGLSAPTVSNLTVGTTTVNMTLTLQGYSENMCPVSSIIIDASPSFNITVPLDDDISRPPIDINLTDLTAESIYILNITAINSAGPSTPLVLAVLTQPDS